MCFHVKIFSLSSEAVTLRKLISWPLNRRLVHFGARLIKLQKAATPTNHLIFVIIIIMCTLFITCLVIIFIVIYIMIVII